MRRMLCVAVIVAMSGCTFAKVSEQGEQVRVSEPAALQACERIGKTNTKTTSKIWVFKRNRDRVNRELEALARDDAAEMGGTDVTPLDTEEGGRLGFAIYRCPATP